MAKEGPIDKAINYYNDTNGKFDRREVHGSDWGLDDTGNNLNEGIITLKEPYLNYYDEEFFNEKIEKLILYILRIGILVFLQLPLN